jgi:hypothetical protein
MRTGARAAIAKQKGEYLQLFIGPQKKKYNI